MKVLQTRAAAEPILLVTTCHNMNLLAVVTRSLVVVYRSTTLTVVTSLPLAHRADSDTYAYMDSAVCACWSPSGRLLAVGLACGELFLIDVEGGELVRRFVPRDHPALADEGWDDADRMEKAGAGDGDGTADPLRRPPVLPVSISGPLVACAWATAPADDLSAKPSSPATHSDPSGGSPGAAFAAASLCLAPCAAATSPVLEEAEQSRAPVLVLLDARGFLCLLPGGLQEVGVAAMDAQLPGALDPQSVRVERFTIAESHTASLLLQPRRGESERIGEGECGALRVKLDLRACIAAAASDETVAFCCVAERCRVAAAARVHAQKEWTAAIRRARALLCVDTRGDSFAALRDALVEALAQPSGVVCFADLDAAALTAAAADLSRSFAHMARRLTCAGQRSHDAALHAALEARTDRQQRLALAGAIAAARRRADLFLRRARRESLRESELLLWAVQRAKPGPAVLAASRHPALLRTVHRALRPAAGARDKEADEEAEADAAADRALARVLDMCLCASRDAASRAAAAVTLRAPSGERGAVAAAAGGAAAVRWSGAVGAEGQRAVLWERDGGLAVALVGEEAEVLEIKGLAARHVRASVSCARGFGVFYAKERFVVIDFYES